MARRTAFEQVLRAGVREYARQQRLAAQQQCQAERAAEQARRRRVSDEKLRL